jgi:[ribosomal protein S5]-alanine N-acetyltransferase
MEITTPKRYCTGHDARHARDAANARVLGQTGSVSAPTVSLRQVDEAVARTILDGGRASTGWADDFPARGDIAAMHMSKFSPDPNEPWFGSYLILVDNIVSGTIGFKGGPVANEVEIGYGVVPSRQGRGVATSAISQLLARIVGLNLEVRAETDSSNVASQSVLSHAGFQQISRRHDPEGGELIIWGRHVD